MQFGSGMVGKTVVVAALLLVGADRSYAQTLSVSGSPAEMTVSSAIAGSQPITVTDAATTYSVSALLIQKKKVTARLSASMPSGVTLQVTLVAPSGATSLGTVSLDTIDRDLITNVANALPETNTITFRLTATTAAGVLVSATRTVTFSLVNYP